MSFQRTVASARARVLVAATPLLMVASPAPAAATDCYADAWAQYNACLTSSGGWIKKSVCDVAFLMDQLACMHVEII